MKQYKTSWGIISILIYLTIIIIIVCRCSTINDQYRVGIGAIFGVIIGVRICMIINNED